MQIKTFPSRVASHGMYFLNTFITSLFLVPTDLQNSPIMKTYYGTSYADEFANKPSMAEYLQKLSKKEREVVKDLLDNVYRNKEKRSIKEPIERISKWDGPSWK